MNHAIQHRLSSLRQAMSAAGIAATIIPQTDSHQSEYIADFWQVRRFLSGFTGSAGTLVVTADKALLWTDSRYFLQAAQQLEGTSVILMKEGIPGVPTIADWLANELPAGSSVGIDMMVYSYSERQSLCQRLGRRGISVVDFDPASVWSDRPALPPSKIFIHDIKYAGKSAKDKISTILQNGAEADADSVFISALDEIAWTLNIRSSDVQYNPVATAFLYLSANGSTLFTDPSKLTDEVVDYLKNEGVVVRGYTDVLDFLASLPADSRVLVEPGRNASKIFDILGNRAVKGDSPVALPKACKNDTQLAGVRAAMERDGVALVKAFMEIERRLSVGERLTEMDIAEILRTMRSAQPLFFDESFGTIAGYGPHGAIVHYEADETSNSIIETGNLLLIDSGAQYLDGTTDITRTISIGQPTDLQRHDFTLVMKGHIALARQIFPEGTRGAQLDALARQFLWNEGLSYLHGTGHGVGHFLNVHEGPQSIRLNNVPATLHPGMITSNEPGLYRENIHGIRCENLVLTIPAMETEFGKFYRFETLTLFPFDLSLFDKSIMTDDEIEWINSYHTTVRARLSPLLNSAERTWLELKTRTL